MARIRRKHSPEFKLKAVMEIFMSSEVAEKRQILNLVFQELEIGRSQKPNSRGERAVYDPYGDQKRRYSSD